MFAPEPGHEAPLDRLRGTSSVFVLVFHCAVWLPAALPESYRALLPAVLAFWRQTWWGVDVFFVLSGFLIGRILMRRLQRGSPGFRAFYLRRSLRIFPVYSVVLAASVLAALALLFRFARGAVRPLVLLALLAVPTLARWLEYSSTPGMAWRASPRS